MRCALYLATLTLSLLAILASSATAAPVVTVTQAKQIADRAWPTSPCAGRLVVVPNPALIAEGHDGSTAPDDSCRIEIAPGLEPGRRCDVIVHEAGHRAGLYLAPGPHAATGVMSEHGAPWPPCHPMTLRDHVKADVAALVPDPDPFVACTGWQGTVMRCRAEWTQGARSWARVARFRVRRAGETYAIRRLSKGKT